MEFHLRKIIIKKNRISDINTLAGVMVQYSLGIVNYTIADIKRTHINTKQLLTCIVCIVLRPIERSRGLFKLELSYKTTIVFQRYSGTTEDWVIFCVMTKNIKEIRDIIPL